VLFGVIESFVFKFIFRQSIYFLAYALPPVVGHDIIAGSSIQIHGAWLYVFIMNL